MEPTVAGGDPATITTKATLDSGACSGSIQVSNDNFVTCIPLGGDDVKRTHRRGGLAHCHIKAA